MPYGTSHGALRGSRDEASRGVVTPSLEAVADDGRRALVFVHRVMARCPRHRDARDDVELGVGGDVGGFVVEGRAGGVDDVVRVSAHGVALVAPRGELCVDVSRSGPGAVTKASSDISSTGAP